jgi:hypothetical protein
VVLIIDNAPWHRGGPIDEALAECPHLQFKRLPSYSPQLNVIERFWNALRRRATHNRLFLSLADLKRSLRARLCYFQTVRGRVRGLRQQLCPARKPDNISGRVNESPRPRRQLSRRQALCNMRINARTASRSARTSRAERGPRWRLLSFRGLFLATLRPEARGMLPGFVAKYRSAEAVAPCLGQRLAFQAVRPTDGGRTRVGRLIECLVHRRPGFRRLRPPSCRTGYDRRRGRAALSGSTGPRGPHQRRPGRPWRAWRVRPGRGDRVG